MRDRWINAGCDEEELKPFVEPELDITDQKRIGTAGGGALLLWAPQILHLRAQKMAKEPLAEEAGCLLSTVIQFWHL